VSSVAALPGVRGRKCLPGCTCGRHKSHTVTADGRRRIREAKHRQYSKVDFCGKKVPREYKEAIMATKPDVCEVCGRPPKKVFQNELRRRQQRMLQASVRNAVCMSGSRS
jgi:hypothetical protein